MRNPWRLGKSLFVGQVLALLSCTDIGDQPLRSQQSDPKPVISAQQPKVEGYDFISAARATRTRDFEREEIEGTHLILYTINWGKWRRYLDEDQERAVLDLRRLWDDYLRGKGLDLGDFKDIRESNATIELRDLNGKTFLLSNQKTTCKVTREGDCQVLPETKKLLSLLTRQEG